MNDSVVTDKDGFFLDIAARLDNAGVLRHSEQWKREFIIAPVLTSRWGLNLRPWDIECEVSYPLTRQQRDKIKTDFRKDLSRVRPDYIVCPDDNATVALVVEAKKQLNKTNPLEKHAAQVLIEQLVTQAPWAILTDGEVWMLILHGKPLLLAESVTDLGHNITRWQKLVGKEILSKIVTKSTSLMQILVTTGEPLDGRDPTQEEKARLESFFPKMVTHGFRVVANDSNYYNSFAAVVGDRGCWWEPDPMETMFWPNEAPREYSLSAYREAFASLGFNKCSHEALQPDYSKIIVFGKAARPFHAAYQTKTGLWISKLGRMQEVLHELYDLEGKEFGEPVLIMSKKHTEENSQQPAPAYSVPATRPQRR